MSKLITILMLLTVLVSPTMADIFDPPPDWTIPGVNNGITQIGDGIGGYPSGGKIKVNIDPGQSCLTIARVESPFSNGGFKYGSITCPVETYYYPNWRNLSGLATNNASLFVQLKKGEYDFQALGTFSQTPFPFMPVTATWYVSGASWCAAPLFGMKQCSQTGDNTLMAYGYATIAQAGCCIASMHAMADRLGAFGTLTFHGFVEKMDDAKGFTKDGFLNMSVAARLLGLRYLGSKSFSDITLAKYHGQGYGIIVKVHRPNRPKNKNHWVVSTNGVVLEGSKVRWGMMNPCTTDSGSYFDEAPFSTVETRIFCTNRHFICTQDGWWNNLWADSDMVPSSSAGISGVLGKNVSAAPDQSSTSTMLELSEFSVISSSGVRIIGVERPGLPAISTGTESNNGSLIDTAGGADDDEAEDPPSPPDSEPDPPLHSEFSQNLAPAGVYRLSLLGQPNTPYCLDVFKGDSFGSWTTSTVEGILDGLGAAVVRLDHEPGNIVSSIAEIKKLQVGNTVGLQNRPITFVDSARNEFFCEDGNRVAGVRVTVADGTTIPDTWSLALVVGKITSLSPEPTIAAESVKYGGWIMPLSPIGMPGKWPEMANCLLAKIWGKVTTIDGANVVIDNSSGPVTVTELDIPVAVGDNISFQAVLRANRIVRAIAGTASNGTSQ